MQNLNRVTLEALSVLKCVLEDQLEERYAYRNEIKRLTLGGITLPFASLEHFLNRYGYLSIDQRSDTLNLTSSGLEAARHHESRLSSLDDDVLYHFAKEIQELAENNVSHKVHTGKRFDQHYIRFEGIGRGGLGSVWRAEHLKSGRLVAIKTLEGIDELVTSGRKSTIKKRLERVVRQLATLSHPFICPVLDLSVHHTPPYYVMPLYQGGSLRDLLQQGPMPPEVALNLFYQICLALKHAHKRDVLHLDLKPENILIDEQGNVKIFDFGMSHTIAKQVAQHGRHSYVGLGSVAYMAPELLRDAQLESVSVDIYGLGLILYEMLVGELPGRRSPMPSDVIEGLPEPIDELFDVMTQDHPSQRPQSLDDVFAILNRVPPFDRLSTQSVVMHFVEPPLPLPGLKALELPEPEEAEDLKESERSMGVSSDAHRASLSPAKDHQGSQSVNSSQERDVSRESEGTAEGEKVELKERSSADRALVPSPEALKGERDSDDATTAHSDNASAEEVEAAVNSALNDHKTLNHQGEPSASAPSEGVVTSTSPASSEPAENFEGSDDPIASIDSDLSLSGSELLRSRLQQITEVIPSQARGQHDFVSSRDADTMTFDAEPPRTELDHIREEVLEELDELEEIDDSVSDRDVLSSASPVHYSNPKGARSMQSASLPGDFEDDDQTELKSVKSDANLAQKERLHQWPPVTRRSSQASDPRARRTSSIQQQIRERRERDQNK